MRKFFYSLTHRLLTDNISFLAGGVAFYGLLALFPAMGALVALMALAANPQVVQEQLQEARFLFPPEVYTLLHDQILSLVKQSNDTLGVTFFISVFLALLSANRGTKGLLAALNMIFRVRENRIWWRQQLVSLSITFGGLSMAMVALVMIVAMPIVINFMPFSSSDDTLYPLLVLRWAILGSGMFIGILLLFSLGPNILLYKPSLREELVGAAVATSSWLVAAVCGSWIISKVPHLHAAYGSISAVVVLMLWMLISAYCLLLGAAVAAVLAEQRLQPELPELE